VIIVNFKRYPQAEGDSAVKLTEICHKLSKDYSLPIIPVPQAKDMAACLTIGINCWTQKFEPDIVGPTGLLLNHSDYRLPRSEIEVQLKSAQEKSLQVCLCTASPQETKELVILKPSFILYEPPELIGSTTTSVAQAKPESILQTFEICKQFQVPFLVGAGIKSGQDIKVSLENGAIGVGVASAVVHATNQAEILKELAQAFK
jgi:triosephosphate isomerase (TIM)